MCIQRQYESVWRDPEPEHQPAVLGDAAEDANSSKEVSIFREIETVDTSEPQGEAQDRGARPLTDTGAARAHKAEEL